MTSPSRKTVTLRITHELDRKLVDISRTMGIPRNSLMSILLDEGVAEKLRQPSNKISSA